MKKALFYILLLLFWTSQSLAADLYVRAGATGTNCTNGWGASDACGQITTALSNASRGDDIWVAGGTYNGYTFNEAYSGTQTVRIYKAIIANHGGGTNWSDGYATQAIINAPIHINKGYFELNGQERDEDDWFDSTAYGFKIYHNGTDKQVTMGFQLETAITNVEWKYVYIQAQQNMPAEGVGWQHIYIYRSVGTGTFTDINIRRSFFQYGSVCILYRTSQNNLIEYSAFDANESNDNNHGEVTSAYYGVDNFTIRYNKTRAIVGTAVWAFDGDGWEIYGNVDWNSNVGDGYLAFDGNSHNNNKVYNNTIVDGTGWNSGIAYGTGSGNVAYNNLWINNSTVNISGTHDYSGFSDSNARGESNAQINIATSIFTNYSGDDFTLASATDAGMTLSSPYDTDMNGLVRGNDGNWDRGAYEYQVLTHRAIIVQ